MAPDWPLPLGHPSVDDGPPLAMGELRSGTATEVCCPAGQELGAARAALLGELLKANTSVTKLDLSGASCTAEALRLLAAGVAASSMPLAELLLRGAEHEAGSEGVASRLSALLRGACRPSLSLVDCAGEVPRVGLRCLA